MRRRRWDFFRFERFPPRSVPRPVEGGIRARSRSGDIGATWWSRRFVAVLESFAMGPRLKRGRSYARRGQVLELEVEPGRVRARVQGSRPKPYSVRIDVKPLGGRDWERAEEVMARRAVFLAKLLAGEMPQEIEEAFAACRLSLFPARRQDLATDCSCPDWANPCKHVAAVYYLLAERFDEDPFTIFHWRGRSKEELLERLRARRAAFAAPEAAPPAEPPEPPARPGPERASVADFWRMGADLSGLALDPRVAEVPDAVLKELGRPPVEVPGEDAAALLSSAYEAFTRAAERRARGEKEPEPPVR